jgi:hypothetical protein
MAKATKGSVGVSSLAASNGFAVASTAPPIKKSFVMMAPDMPEPRQKGGDDGMTLYKSIVNILNGGREDSVERLAFETDPQLVNQFQSVYRAKLRLVPDVLLKRIMIQDDLVASIVRARETQMSAFGRPRPDRFSTGYVIEPRVGIVDKMTPEEKQTLEVRIEGAVRKFETCGSNEGLDREDFMSFSQYLMMSARNAVGLGRIATEIIWTKTARDSEEKKFHSFRPTDAGTIYKATKQKQAAEAVRKQALAILKQITNKKLIEEKKFFDDEYAWIQVIDGQPRQALRSDEMAVHTFFPVADVELDGYPVTPIDTMMSAITTHINITTSNRLYFQSGRATRGMLLFKSDDIDEHALARIKQQFNASINNVNNSYRMPVFAVGSGDEITWEPIDNSSRDTEFQYLTDMNARVILSAFQMSPDELPGWSYLSRGTNNQALSESNNEYRLEAARDLGIRPLLANFEDFVNSVLFPLIDPDLAKICRLKFKGLDADTEEKESVRLQQDMPVHMTYDQVLQKVEKKPIGRAMGGEFPLNPQFQDVLDKYFTVGQILEFFMGVEGASKDPKLAYFRDPFWFQYQQLLLQQQQLQMQQQQAQMQQAAAQQQAAGTGGPGAEQAEGSGVDVEGSPGGGDDQQPGGKKDKTPYGRADDDQQAQAQQKAGAEASAGQDLTRSIDQAIAILTKSESHLPLSKRKLLAQSRKTLDHFRIGLENDAREATKEIVALAEKHVRP